MFDTCCGVGDAYESERTANTRTDVLAERSAGVAADVDAYAAEAFGSPFCKI